MLMESEVYWDILYSTNYECIVCIKH